MEITVGTIEELRDEGCRIIDVGGRPVGVISVGDEFYAIADKCPHMGVSMCAGSLSGTMVASAPHEYEYGNDDRVIRCPWHGWEFDLATGRSLLEPKRHGLRTYEVTTVDGQVVLHA